MALGTADPETNTITTVVRDVACGRHPEDVSALCIRLSVHSGVTVDALITWEDALKLANELNDQLCGKDREYRPCVGPWEGVLPAQPNPIPEDPTDGE